MEDRSKATILVVNDIPDQLELMSLVMERAGYRVLTASDGHDGFQTAQRERPQLVISDVVMPRTSGIELCHLIRADAALRTTPILLISGLQINTANVVEGLRAGADDYLETPFDPIYLTAKVRRLIERTQMMEALQESEERFRLLVEGVRDYAIFMLDPEGHIVSWNPGVKRILGYEEAEFIGQPVSIIYTPEDIEQGVHQQEMKMAAAEGRAEDERWHIRRDGTRFWASGVVDPTYNGQGRLRGFSKVMRDITERKAAEERIIHEASHDALTGLPNRALFNEHLKRTIAHAKRHEDYLYAVMFLDLDQFKTVNDSLGHTVGDQLLVVTARKLESAVRPEDVVARLGGDEFTVLLHDIHSISDAIRIASRIHHAFGLPFTLDGHDVFTTPSIGIALSTHGYSYPEEVLRDADTAMYRAKTAGRGRYEIFDQSMHERVMHLLKLETDLRRAVEREQFRIHYQPIMSLENNQLTGFEALVRWQHPERGLVMPNEFIPIAEDTGLIAPIGHWVLHEACRQVQAWQNPSGRELALSVNVNLSGKQFSQADLIEQISSVLE